MTKEDTAHKRIPAWVGFRTQNEEFALTILDVWEGATSNFKEELLLSFVGYGVPEMYGSRFTFESREAAHLEQLR